MRSSAVPHDSRRNISGLVPCVTRLAVALAAAAVVAGCGTKEIETTPFSLTATVAATGVPLGGGPQILTIAGEAAIDPQDAAALTIADPAFAGGVRLAFRNTASPDVRFPPQLDGQPVVAHLLVANDAGYRGPRGEPIDYPGLRIAVGDQYQFILGEGPIVGPAGLPAMPRPLDLERDAAGNVLLPPAEDFPIPTPFADWAEFEAARCGVVYYDLLRLDQPDFSGSTVLRKGGRTQMTVFGRTWTVVHVLSWHRTGHCPGRTQAWTQVAGWRS